MPTLPRLEHIFRFNFIDLRWYKKVALPTNQGDPMLNLIVQLFKALIAHLAATLSARALAKMRRAFAEAQV